MRSKAHFKSHPLHPILVAFPIAFYTGTFLFDIVAVLTDNLQLAVTGKYLHIAGIAGAILAAVPGLIDYIYTVPPKSSAKNRARKHGLLNSTALVIFCILLFMKFDLYSPATILVGELIVVILTVMAGWMGGTLVYRNQIGVDIRYAFAGKWNELHTSKSPSIFLGSTAELLNNQMKLIHIDGKRIVLAKTEEGFVAFDDRCPHKGGSLAGGAMLCGTVQCPWHGSQFDVTRGDVKAGPARSGIKTYRVTESAGKLYLEL